jgi:hypothetical protein
VGKEGNTGQQRIGVSLGRFLERDEAIRREPRPPYAWDGVGEARPFGAMEKNIVEGVY